VPERAFKRLASVEKRREKKKHAVLPVGTGRSPKVDLLPDLPDQRLVDLSNSNLRLFVREEGPDSFLRNQMISSMWHGWPAGMAPSSLKKRPPGPPVILDM
jgi:hypothetical protein